MRKITEILLGLCFFNLSVASAIYAQDSALEKAKTSIQAYFKAILTGESTLSADMAMATTTKEVPEKDQSSLQDYYNQISFSAAKQAVDAYIQKVAAGQDSSSAADSMHEIEDALSPDNLQKIMLYYDQVKKINPK